MNPLASTPRLIGLLGDVHENTQRVVAQIETAYLGGADILIQLGDLEYGCPTLHNERFLSRMNRALKRFGLVAVFVRGNHDDPHRLAEHALELDAPVKIFNTLFWLPQTLRWRWDGHVWAALGGAVSVHKHQPGAVWWPEETITGDEVARLVADGPVDLLLCHDCPASDEFVIPGLGAASPWPASVLAEANEHRDLLRTAVDRVRPRHLWHAHFHIRNEAVITLATWTDRPEVVELCRVHGLADSQNQPARQLAFAHTDGSLVPRALIDEAIAEARSRVRVSLPPGAEPTVEAIAAISRHLVHDALGHDSGARPA